MKINYLLQCWSFFLMLGISTLTSRAQITVYNNFGSGHDGWDYNYGLGWTIAGEEVPQQYGVEQAMLFESTATGVLTDIWLAISRVPISTLPDTVIIRLTTNPNGLPPDTADIMEEWVLTGFSSWSQWNTPHHLEGGGTSVLQEGESYWLWAMGTETTWCMWCMNEDPALTIPHTMRREGEDWLSISNETASAFRVDISDGTSVNDPARGSLTLLYPNPCTEYIYIGFSVEASADITARITGLDGKSGITVSLGNQTPGSHSTRIDTQVMPAGIYLLQVWSDQKLLGTRKLIRE